MLDSTKREAYRRRDPFVVAGADLRGYRTIVSVPMIKANELIGVVSIYRQEVRAFTDKQIDLVKSFASQAVTALENARGCSVNCARSLQQQTATADVLKGHQPVNIRPAAGARHADRVQPRGCAMPISLPSFARKVTRIIGRRATACPRTAANISSRT